MPNVTERFIDIAERHAERLEHHRMMLREATELLYTLTGYAESKNEPQFIGATIGESRAFLARFERFRVTNR